MKVAGDPLVGRVLGGRYRIEGLLGAGGMGAVYAATQLHIDRPVAIKMLVGDVDARAVERLRIEAFAAGKLGHPNIVQVIDYLPADEEHPPCLVMEKLAGRSLASVLIERRALPVPLAVHIARQMLDALGAAHAAGIVHRDVKPGNVMVLDPTSETPPIKVIDFGLAKLMDDGSRHTTTGTVLGTPSFMAPEQHLALPPTPSVDVWAMGVCLYLMLSGERPFTGTIVDIFRAVTSGDPPDLAKVAPHVPREIVDVVTRALTRDPAQRFPDARAMRAALDAKPVTLPPPVVPAAAPPPPPRPPPPNRVRPFLLAMTAVVVAGALVAGAFALGAREVRPAPVSLPVPDATSSAAIAIVETGATVEEASSSAEPPASASASAPSSSAPAGKRVPCICADGWVPICAEPRLECTCNREGAGTICWSEWPDGHCPMDDYRHYERVDRTGETCRGWQYGVGDDGAWHATRTEGKHACSNACGRAWAGAHPTNAVPGTPCSGYIGATPAKGKWARLIP